MITVKFPKDGNNLPMTVTMQDSDGAIIDLTGGTVSLLVDRGDTTTFTQAGVLLTPTSGVCQFLMMAVGALARPGKFKSRVIASVGVQVMPTEWFTLAVE